PEPGPRARSPRHFAGRRSHGSEPTAAWRSADDGSPLPGATPQPTGFVGDLPDFGAAMATVQEAIDQLRNYAALDEQQATALVDAVVDVARQEAVDAIADEQLVPTSVAARNVARVAAVCEKVGRLL